MDNFLGELKFATTIDTMRVVGKESAEGESIPIEKLKDYLVWRQKEFIEKYDGARRSTEKDSYVLFTAKLNSGNELIAVINTDMLSWDAKASHPWVLCVEIEYVGKNSGMPEEVTYQMLEEFENDMLAKLKDADGYLNIGRQTADGIRTIYFACRDFRKPSLVVYGLSKKYASKFKMTYDIYKDKYWRSFNRFTEGAE